MPDVYELLFDDENEAKINSHSIGIDQLMQILDNPFMIASNRSTGRAPYLLVGRDNSGACIASPIEPTHNPELWRPITAWYCKTSEQAALERHWKHD